MIHTELKDVHSAWLRSGASAAVLHGVHEPGVELAIWRRTLSPCLAWWLERFPYDQLPEGRVLCPLTDLRAAVTSMMSPAAPCGPMQDLLLDDIVAIGRLFAKESGADLLDVRLERLDDDGCAAFHRDCVDLRLLTTYRGPGTEWIAPEHADRALAQQTCYRGPIERLPPHAVALLRGCAAVHADGLVHRSPPIEETMTTRLLLCINTPSAASPARWQRRTQDNRLSG